MKRTVLSNPSFSTFTLCVQHLFLKIFENPYYTHSLIFDDNNKVKVRSIIIVANDDVLMNFMSI